MKFQPEIEMETKKNQYNFMQPAIATVLLLASMLAWGFFLNSTGMSFEILLGQNGFTKIFDTIVSTGFAFFALIFPLTIALLCVYSKILERKEMYAIITISFTVFGLIVFVFLKNIAGFTIAGILLFVSFFIATETCFIKFKELKKLPFMRASMSALSQVNLFLGIGLFLSAAFFVFPNQQQIITELEEKTIALAINKDLKTELIDSSSLIFIEGQKQTINSMTSNPLFEALYSSPDPNAVAFAQATNLLSQTINSQSYLQEIKNQANQLSEHQLSEQSIQNTFNEAKKTIPIIGLIENNFWLIFALTISSLYLFIANVLFKPLTAIYGLVLGLFIQNLEKNTPA